jgi:hypothetical protein
MTPILSARSCAALAIALAAGTAEATVIDFDSQSLSGPGTYAAAGANRDLSIATAAGNVTITGGTVLTQETFLPANSTSLYGTAFFAAPLATSTSSTGYRPTITLNFPTLVNSFYLDVYNGQTFNVTYTVADNNGHSASFVLVPNLSSGTTQIGFSPANASSVTITSDAGSAWDFSIDNIVFNEGVPTTVPVTTAPPPTTIDPPNPAPVLVSIDNPPPQATDIEIQLREEDSRKQRRRGHNGRNSVQGFEDSVAPVPLPPGMLLFGSALPGLVLMRRRSRAS